MAMQTPLLAPLAFTAPSPVGEAISAMGRTEDLAFSPSCTRLAIAEFANNRILLLDIAREERLKTGDLVLTGFAEFSSGDIHSPHGLAFLNEETLVVANREGTSLIFRLPPSGSTGRVDLAPTGTIRGSWLRRNTTPGSVAVSKRGISETELLICNNYRHTVSRHVLDSHHDYRVKASRLLLREGLMVPDGVAVNRDERWIAISNHGTHTVLIFEYTRETNPETEPVGTLLDVDCPHGLAFTDDGERLVVASAAAPFIHVFAREVCLDAPGPDGWRGTRVPVASIRVMDDETFLKGRYNPEEGGPKGLELSGELNLLVTTSEHQPLAFFDLDLIDRVSAE